MAPQNSAGFPADPAVAKRTALLISFALLSGCVMFGAIVASTVPLDGSAPKAETSTLDGLPVSPSTITSGVAVVLVLISTSIARRMHAEHGALDDRVREALKAHIFASALAEGAALLGLVFVMTDRSWEHGLAPVLGIAALALGIVRAALVFGRFEAEKSKG